MAHYRYYKKTKSLSFGLKPPVHRLGEIEPTNVFLATTDPCHSSKWVYIWENGGRKTCFWPTIEDGHAYGAAWLLIRRICNYKLNCFIYFLFAYLLFLHEQSSFSSSDFGLVFLGLEYSTNVGDPLLVSATLVGESEQAVIELVDLRLRRLAISARDKEMSPVRASIVKDGTASVIASTTVRSQRPRPRSPRVSEGTTDGEGTSRLTVVRLITSVECLRSAVAVAVTRCCLPRRCSSDVSNALLYRQLCFRSQQCCAWFRTSMTHTNVK